MIISHKHKFIFIKPGKVAGTAIEIALRKSCSESDIVTPISKYDPSCDQDAYEYYPQNNFGYCEHISLDEIKKLTPRIFDQYCKVTIIRNPWDMVVSKWHWECWIYSIFGKPNIKSYINMFKKLCKNKTYTFKQLNRKLNINLIRTKISKDIEDDNFKSFAENFPDIWTNDQYFFLNGDMVIDSVIRFESLKTGFIALC
ncbi:hypothetical protein N9174_03920, partial [bacterium]|nr:hypothetical protein [bacterium]